MNIQELSDYKFEKYLKIGFDDIVVLQYFDFLNVKQTISKLEYKDIKRLNKLLKINQSK